jgi:hypothetical protein
MLFASTPDNAQSRGKNCHPEKKYFSSIGPGSFCATLIL